MKETDFVTFALIQQGDTQNLEAWADTAFQIIYEDEEALSSLIDHLVTDAGMSDDELEVDDVAMYITYGALKRYAQHTAGNEAEGPAALLKGLS